jgi:hypothetical protein
LHLTEKDIFKLVNEKIGPARRIITHIKKEQVGRKEKSEEYRGIIVEEVENVSSNQVPTQRLIECAEDKGIVEEDQTPTPVNVPLQNQDAKSQEQVYISNHKG